MTRQSQRDSDDSTRDDDPEQAAREAGAHVVDTSRVKALRAETTRDDVREAAALLRKLRAELDKVRGELGAQRYRAERAEARGTKLEWGDYLECECCGGVGALPDKDGLYYDGQALVCGCAGCVSCDGEGPAYVSCDGTECPPHAGCAPDQVVNLQCELAERDRTIGELRKALCFYCSPVTWKRLGIYGNRPIDGDCGHTAMSALGVTSIGELEALVAALSNPGKAESEE